MLTKLIRWQSSSFSAVMVEAPLSKALLPVLLIFSAPQQKMSSSRVCESYRNFMYCCPTQVGQCDNLSLISVEVLSRDEQMWENAEVNSFSWQWHGTSNRQMRAICVQRSELINRRLKFVPASFSHTCSLPPSLPLSLSLSLHRLNLQRKWALLPAIQLVCRCMCLFVVSGI